MVGRHPPQRVPGRLGPRCPCAGLEPPAVRAAALSDVSICSQAGAPSQLSAASPPPRLPGRFFRWKPALPRPTLIKALRKGREFLPAQVTPPSQFPTCSALPLRPGQGKLQGARPWQEAEWDPRPSPAQLHHPTPDSHRHAGRGLLGTPAGGDCPSACIQVLGRECCLGPPATLWS